MIECRACRDGWEHCHGTLITHRDRPPECTEDGCDTPGRAPHTYNLDCEAVGCRCGHGHALAV